LSSWKKKSTCSIEQQTESITEESVITVANTKLSEPGDISNSKFGTSWHFYYAENKLQERRKKVAHDARGIRGKNGPFSSC
jgi:hypothetical protein